MKRLVTLAIISMLVFTYWLVIDASNYVDNSFIGVLAGLYLAYHSRYDSDLALTNLACLGVMGASVLGFLLFWHFRGEWGVDTPKGYFTDRLYTLPVALFVYGLAALVVNVAYGGPSHRT